MTTIFNQQPYWDDYDPDKKFYKILFRPGYAVQARELTQLQTIIQKQIERFGEHIFKEGSIVLGGDFDYQKKTAYVRLSGISVSEDNRDLFIGKNIVGIDSDLRAHVVTAIIDEDDDSKAIVLYVRYLNSNEIDETEFRNDETVAIEDLGFTATVEDSDISTGFGTLFTITSGVVFAKGYFVNFPRETIVVDKYNTAPTQSIGFRIKPPEIVTANDDRSLLDNARGSSNYAAPGADRLVLSLTLDSLDPDEADNNDDFVTIFRTEEGIVAQTEERTQYSRVYEEIAKRTFDESGDYYVRGLTIRTREALDTGENEGLDPNGDSEQLSVDVEPGLAYVKGYEVSNRITHHELIDKSTDFEYVNNAIVSARTGGYIVVNEVVGSFNIDEGTQVNLYDTAEQRVTNELNVSGLPSGNLIGTARVKTVIYDSGELGTPDGSIRLYLFDINIDTPNVFPDVEAIQTDSFFADVSEGFSENIENTLIYRIGQEAVRKLRTDTQLENTTDTSYSFYTTSSSVINQNSTTITVTSSEQLDYSIGQLSDVEKQNILLSVDTSLGSPNNFYEGQYIDLTDPTVIINVVSTTSFTIDLGDKFTEISSSVPVTVSYRARRSQIFEASKALTPNVYVKIGLDQAGAPDVEDGIPLGLADVHAIRSIRIASSDGGSDPFVDDETVGSDVTNFFIVDNGQRDNYYDHARLIPRGITIANDDWLLVKLDYFKSNTHSYFSVDSYPIDDTIEADDSIFTYQIPEYTTSSGETYNLRNCFDFRPVKQSTASEAQDVSSATINPNFTDNFIGNETTDKLLIPFPSSRIEFDYSYYLARRDIITLNEKGNFSIVRGKPSLSPLTPTVPENVMGLAVIFIPPYPSTSQTFARIIGLDDGFCTHERIAFKRYTMRDINILEDRIGNLEYYSSLNLLEKDTADLKILDDAGNDRFKNGFFVDGFLDHSLGDTTNNEYNIAIDREEQSARPVFDMESFRFRYDSGPSQLEQTGNLIHLPVLSEKTLVEQNNATTIRNVEQSVYRFIGNLELDPDNDTWVDETTVDKNVEFGNNIPSSKTMTTEWGSWENHVTGKPTHSVYQREWNDRSGDVSSAAGFVGSFSSYSEAKAATSGAGKFGGNRTLIETSGSDRTRTGTKVSVNYEKETQELGNFVTDVSVIPYIRPQAINFYASGIKPRTRHYVFFDGEDVTKYVRQYEDIENPDTFTPSDSNLRSNEFGEIRGVLFLPSSGKRFRVGTKDVVVTDNPTDSAEDITSRAENYFLASGLNVQKQNTTLSTKTVSGINAEVITEREQREADTEVIGPSCIAYTFKVEVPTDEEGIFVSSIDLFFQQFHPDLGFRVQIRELNSGGNITQNVIPYSEVWLDRKVRDSEGNRIDNPILQTSEDGTVPTTVPFKAPVFLYNDTSYAVVISSENINPDTYLWISRIGETDVASQRPVTSRRLTGALYTTNNSVNWDIVPQADLKFKLYRAEFDTNQSYTGFLRNDAFEFFNLENTTSVFDVPGEIIRGSDLIRVSISDGTVTEGNTIEGSSSGVTGTVVSVDGQTVGTTAMGLENGESITFTDDGTTVASGSITSIDRGVATLRKYTGLTDKLTLEKSNGRFFEGAKLVGDTSEVEAFVESYDSFPYSTIDLKPDYLDFQSTNVDFDRRGRLSSDNSLTNYVNANEDKITSFNNENVILSRSQEIELFGESGFSSDIRMTVSSDSEYLSPIIDMSRANSVYVRNRINSDTSNEIDPNSDGSLINKYISKVITLDDGQDAEDLKLLLTVYRPPSQVAVENDVVVWVRIRNADDPTSVRNREWMQMIPESEVFSSIDNKGDFIEVEYNVDPEFFDVNGVISYDTEIESESVTLSTFKQFQIKVGLVGENSAIVPKVADLRSIALQR